VSVEDEPGSGDSSSLRDQQTHGVPPMLSLLVAKSGILVGS
jgi:hypothetical protein